VLKLTFLAASSALWLCATLTANAQEDPFRSQVRPTDPLTPAEEQQSFQLPPGFQIELVTAEPDILKPLNLAFDLRGRLWVSMSQEYPYAAPPDREPTDCIKILEDTTGDGHYDKITTFADKLNIPIGLYPYQNGVICWSIPNIWYLADTNGDDVADQRTVLYGPFDYSRDTHGMNNGFTRGFDGWLYACHGFNNDTTVAGADGNEIHMQSGNTYRMRTDGRRIEHFTHGQVNPFGMTQDERGNLFTADCHSKPIYQLVAGGYYPSFGKPHDGLGFVPPMMDHLHGSTAIAGVAIYEDNLFPPEFRGNMFSGNVMTSRINRNRLEYHGSTIRAIEQPDFVSTTDPWFRPVDIELGPDGALYVADFYNRIIGHYEVPLTHPGRDRTSGRIWRITYNGADHAARRHSQRTLQERSLDELAQELENPNLPRRMLVTDYLADDVGDVVIPVMKKVIAQSNSPAAVAHAIWVLFRRGATRDLDFPALLTHPAALVRLHAVRLLHEMGSPDPQAIQACEFLLNDQDAFVRRAAAETLGRHGKPSAELEQILLRTLEATPADDAIMRYTTRMALRDLWSRDPNFPRQPPDPKHPELARLTADIALGMPTESAGVYLVDYLTAFPEETARSADYIKQIAGTLPTQRLPQVVRMIRKQFAGQWDQQLSLLFSMRESLGPRRAAESPELVEWADDLFGEVLKLLDQSGTGWRTDYPQADPWDFQTRPCADGQPAKVISSIPHGEQLTGTLTSPVFEAPAKFSFYLCGHRGFPNLPAHEKNKVTLHDAETNDVLKTAYPPRNDTAQKIEWDLSDIAGRKVYLQATDNDTANAYAWLAFGRIEPPVISIPQLPPRQTGTALAYLADLKQNFHLEKRSRTVRDFFGKSSPFPEAQVKLASALLEGQPRPLLQSLSILLGSPQLPSPVRTRIVDLIQSDSDPGEKLLAEMTSQLPSNLQHLFALALGESAAGRKQLFQLLEQGTLSLRLLQNRAIANRLNTVATPAEKQIIAKLTANLPDASAELRELIKQRLASFQRSTGSAERGRVLFEKNCQNCHQIAGKGAVIGPQLDGIGNRGAERLFEDTLDPNQNVDVAFHSMTIVKTDGKVITGLFRREEGDRWILADKNGKEFQVDTGEIEESSRSPLSLMPENIARDLPPAEFFDLMTYLLDQTAKPSAAP